MSLLQWLLSSEVKARERLRRLQQEELAKQGAHEPGPQAGADHEALRTVKRGEGGARSRRYRAW